MSHLHEMSTASVRAEIEALRVPAVSFDTNCFFERGQRNAQKQLVDLDQPWIRTVKWLVARGHKLVMPDIWLREIERNFAATIKVRAALAPPSVMWNLDKELDSALHALAARQRYLTNSSSDIAARILGGLWTETAAVRVTVPDDGLARLLRMWHDGAPPFDVDNQRKKNEFPDALALLALEAFASQSGAKVIVVSRDGECVSFCKSSPWLIAFEDAEVACDALKSRDEIEESLRWERDIASLIHSKRTAYLAALRPKLSAVLVSSLPEREYVGAFRMRTEIEVTDAIELQVGAAEDLPQTAAIEFVSLTDGDEQSPGRQLQFRHRIRVDAMLTFHVYADRPGEGVAWARMGRANVPTIYSLDVTVLVRMPLDAGLHGSFQDCHFYLEAPLKVPTTLMVPADWEPVGLA